MQSMDVYPKGTVEWAIKVQGAGSNLAGDKEEDH